MKLDGIHHVNTDHIVQVMTSPIGNKWTVFTSREDNGGSIGITDPESVERLKALVAS